MRPHGSPFRVLPLALLIAVAAPASAGRWCGDAPYPDCPQRSMGWMLFVDANHGTPDFWRSDSVVVREILVCEHGVQLLFVARQDGRMQHTALVFPRPTATLLADRLGLASGSARLAAELRHFTERYTALNAALAALTGGVLEVGARLTLAERGPTAPPILIPNRRLALRWKGEEVLLRGYLDVYFSSAL